MNGNFLQGLSEGIFERLGQLRQEQQRSDDERKMQTIQLLTGLAGQVEPESLPILMSHLGDTLKIKGRMRKFWDAFSGTPNKSVEDQLGEKLQEVSTSLVGPATAKTVRAGGDMARLFQPQTPEQGANRAARLQSESNLANKLVFRDPRAEKLQGLRETYDLKSAQQEGLLQERENLLRQRQAENDQRDFQNALKIGQQRAELKAHGDVLKRASTIAFGQGVRAPNSEHLRQAAEEISKEQGFNLDLLKARIGLTEARIPLVEAQTKKALRPPSRSSTRAGGRGNDRKMSLALEAFEGLKQSLIEATRRGDQTMMSALRKRLNQMAITLASKYGDRLEVGGGEWPYQKPRTSQGSAGPTPPPTIETVETLPGGIRLTTPAPALNEQQRAIFDDIRREHPNAPDSQILDYMKKKGWLQ
jgi:hypothetical protein